MLLCMTLRVLAVGRESIGGRPLADMYMHISLNAKERTRQELEELLTAAGFSLKAIHMTASPTRIVEAVPA